MNRGSPVFGVVLGGMLAVSVWAQGAAGGAEKVLAVRLDSREGGWSVWVNPDGTIQCR